MTTHAWTLQRPAALDHAQIESLAGLLIDCVDGGASVGS